MDLMKVDVNVAGTKFCPVAGFGIWGFQNLYSATSVLIILFCVRCSMRVRRKTPGQLTITVRISIASVYVAITMGNSAIEQNTWTRSLVTERNQPFKHRVKSHLPSAGIIRSSQYYPH
jgi:hypothetical protein